MEFVGDAVRGMNMEERMTVCNMVVEAGGKNGVIPADQTTFDYVEARTSEAYEPVYSDESASFFAGAGWGVQLGCGWRGGWLGGGGAGGRCAGLLAGAGARAAVASALPCPHSAPPPPPPPPRLPL